MSTRDLMTAAASVGMCVGRSGRNRYYWHQTVGGVLVAEDFNGTWGDFCRFIRNRVEVAR